MYTTNEIESNLPLTETTYFILLSLAPGRRHGYAIMKDVRQLSHDRVVLSTGTLYSALKRLLDQGWIRRAEDSANNANSRGRKDYGLTQLGQSPGSRNPALARPGQRCPVTHPGEYGLIRG